MSTANIDKIHCANLLNLFFLLRKPEGLRAQIYTSAYFRIFITVLSHGSTKKFCSSLSTNT